MNTFTFDVKLEDIISVEINGPFLLIVLKNPEKEKVLNFHCFSHERAERIKTKLNSARRIYLVTSEKERDEKKKHLQKILSVSTRSIKRYLDDIDKDNQEKKDKLIKDMWLACYTQEEIAEAVNMDKSSVSRIIDKDLLQNGQLSDLQQINANFMQDFEPPLYNIWTFAKKTNEVSHFGNSEQRIVDNLLYLYTDIYDVVCDPFAGGGSTIDICKKRLRRYYVSDRKPIVEREKEIRLHDITQGLPSVPRWQEVKLVYLDPPYWKQAAGKYSNDADDLANMDADKFHKTLIDLVNGFAKKLKKDSIIALLIQPTQWKSDNKTFTDHILAITKEVKLNLEN